VRPLVLIPLFVVGSRIGSGSGSGGNKQTLVSRSIGAIYELDDGSNGSKQLSSPKGLALIAMLICVLGLIEIFCLTFLGLTSSPTRQTLRSGPESRLVSSRSIARVFPVFLLFKNPLNCSSY